MRVRRAFDGFFSLDIWAFDVVLNVFMSLMKFSY